MIENVGWGHPIGKQDVLCNVLAIHIYSVLYFFFGMIFIYYTFFEGIFKRTPGKWLSLSKVVNKTGGKPFFWQIIIRSLVRVTVIDCFFIPFLDKPLYDYLSGTAVVKI